jgi:hypothetical protein
MKFIIILALTILIVYLSFEKKIKQQFIGQKSPEIDKKPEITPYLLKLEMSLKYSETTETTLVKILHINIFDRQIIISRGLFTPFSKPSTEEKQNFTSEKIIINQEQEKQIFDYIVHSKLNKNITEKQNSEDKGIAGELIFRLISPEISKIHIEGKTKMEGTDAAVERIWGKQYITSRTNITNIEYFAKANEFINFISNLSE